jgi:hypothetical protein
MRVFENGVQKGVLGPREIEYSLLLCMGVKLGVSS